MRLELVYLEDGVHKYMVTHSTETADQAADLEVGSHNWPASSPVSVSDSEREGGYRHKSAVFLPHNGHCKAQAGLL